MVEQNRSFLQHVLDTNPSQYTSETSVPAKESEAEGDSAEVKIEQNPHSVREIINREGNNALKEFLKEYNVISESTTLTSQEKTQKLKELLSRIESARLGRSSDEEMGDRVEGLSSNDFLPLEQMIEGELQTLEIEAAKETKVELSAYDRLVGLLDSFEERIKSGEIEATEVSTFEEYLNTFESAVEKFSNEKPEADVDDISNHLTEVKTLRDRLKQIESAYLAKWKENDPDLKEFSQVLVERQKTLGEVVPESESELDLLNQVKEDIARVQSLIDSQASENKKRELQYLQESLKGIESNLKSQIESRQEATTKAEQQRKQIESIDKTIQELEKLAPLAIEKDEDVLGDTLKPLYDKLEALQDVLPAEEYKELRKRVLLFDYRYTKRVLQHKLTQDEMNGANKDFYFSSSYDQRFKGQRGFGRLERVLQRIGEMFGETDSLYQSIAKDKKRFETEINIRRTVFYAEQSLEPMIFGQGDAGESASRQIPKQTPEVFPNMDQFRQVVLGLEVDGNPQFVESDQEWTFSKEQDYVRTMPERTEKMFAFESIDGSMTERTFTPTSHGEAMRLIDMLYNNRLHTRIIEVINEGSLSPEKIRSARSLAAELSGFYKDMHISTNKYNIPSLISKAAEIIYGYAPEETTDGLYLTEEEIKQAWYAHTLLLNQSMLIPASSPKMDDRIYKANQWLEYVVSGVEAGTTSASLVHTYALFRKYTGAVKKYLLNSLTLVAPPARKDQGIGNRIARIVSGVKYEKPGEMRARAERALKEAGLDSEYGFLVDLPLVTINKSPFGTYPVIPLPLQYMLFRDELGEKYASTESQKKKEKKVRRWKIAADGGVPHPVTAADYVNENGDIIYELIDWKNILPSTNLEQWYNNGKNITALYDIYSQGTKADMFNFDAIAKMQNDQKYAASFMPGMWGQEVSAERFKAEAVFQRMTIVSVMARAIELVRGNTVKNLDEVEKKLIENMRLLGEGEKGERAVEAILIVLNQVLGPEENQQENADLIFEQIKGFLKYR